MRHRQMQNDGYHGLVLRQTHGQFVISGGALRGNAHALTLSDCLLFWRSLCWSWLSWWWGAHAERTGTGHVFITTCLFLRLVWRRAVMCIHVTLDDIPNELKASLHYCPPRCFLLSQLTTSIAKTKEIVKKKIVIMRKLSVQRRKVSDWALQNFRPPKNMTVSRTKGKFWKNSSLKIKW